MSSNEIHAIKGIGAKANITNNNARGNTNVFNPRVFHRGMIDLQEYILSLNNSTYARNQPDETPDPHTYNETENTITPTPNTALEYIIKQIPNGWNATVVVDGNENYNGYHTVVTALNCGDGVSIWTKIHIREHRISELNFEYTDPADETRTELKTAEKTNFPIRAQETARLIRVLDKAITVGYTTVISTAARAFDYQATVSNPSNDRIPHRSRNIEFNQSYWADVRGTSRQTITNNLSKARDELQQHGIEDVHGDPLPYTHANKKPALTETDSKEDAYVVLV